jgi:hypothetical protein
MYAGRSELHGYAEFFAILRCHQDDSEKI